MTLEVDIDSFIPILFELQLLEISDYKTTLLLMKSDDLKSILRLYNLKVTGKKSELIDRIVNNINESEVTATTLYKGFYLHTDCARKLIEASYHTSNNESVSIMDIIIPLIKSKQLDRAYRLGCKWNAERPVPSGIGVDWQECVRKGIPPQTEKIIYIF